MPSLSRLSPSTRVEAPRTPRLRKVAITATGSVAATIAPTTSPSSNGRPVARSARPRRHGGEHDAGSGEQDHPADRAAEVLGIELQGRLEHETGHEHE